MTRHYWGEFAGYLQGLELSSGSQFQATVNRDAVRTRLCRAPHHGTEACLAEAERSGGRLRMRAIAVAIGMGQAKPRRGIVRMVGRGFDWIDWLFLYSSTKIYPAKIFFKQNSLDLSEERVCDRSSCKALVSCFSFGAIFTELLPRSF